MTIPTRIKEYQKHNQNSSQNYIRHAPVRKVKHIKRGEIYYAEMPEGKGSEQAGNRPVLIIQNDVGNRFSTTTIVASITSVDKSSHLPVHIDLPKTLSHLPDDSVVLLEQIRTIDKQRLLSKVSMVNNEFMLKINQKLLISLGIPGK